MKTRTNARPSHQVLTNAARATRRHQLAVQRSIDRMLQETGGETGRSFTNEEYRVFLVLKDVRDRLRTIRYSGLLG